MLLSHNALTLDLRSPEFGNTKNTSVSRVARPVGNTIKTLQRDLISRFCTYTIRGNCLDLTEILDFMADTLGETIDIDGDSFIVQELPTIHEDSAGYTVIFIAEEITNEVSP